MPTVDQNLELQVQVQLGHSICLTPKSTPRTLTVLPPRRQQSHPCVPLALTLVLLMVTVKLPPRVSLDPRKDSWARMRQPCSRPENPSSGHCHAFHIPTPRPGAPASPLRVTATFAAPRWMLSQKCQSPSASKKPQSVAAQAPCTCFPYPLSPSHLSWPGFQAHHQHAAPNQGSSQSSKARPVLSCRPLFPVVKVLPRGRSDQNSLGVTHPSPMPERPCHGGPPRPQLDPGVGDRTTKQREQAPCLFTRERHRLGWVSASCCLEDEGPKFLAPGVWRVGALFGSYPKRKENLKINKTKPCKQPSPLAKR